MKDTDDLARGAIALSNKLHVTRKAALRILMKRQRLPRPPWVTRKGMRTKREVIFYCVLALIPHFEPNRFNDRYAGRRKPSPKRLEELKRMTNNGHGRDTAASLVSYIHPPARR